jgi:3-methyladenine DNA glycosylase/8-oxoguanine DNA glycosylase
VSSELYDLPGATRRRLSLGGPGFDIALALAHLRSSDPALGRAMEMIGPFVFDRQKTRSVFGALAEAIVYQQLNPKAAATIFGRLCALFPDAPGGPTPDQLLSTGDEHLRSAGLSGAKLRALQDLAQRTLDGTIPSLARLRAMEDEQVIRHLTEVRGIGRWTAEMFLMFRLGRPDVLPVDDYGLRRGFALAFGAGDVPDRRVVAERGAMWAPYRTVASWYLWRVAEQGSLVSR